MRLFYKNFFLGIFLTLTAGVHAKVSDTNGPWIKEVEKPSMTIYTRVIAGQPIREAKATFRTQAKMESLLTILGDVEVFTDWVPFIEKVEWISQPKDGVSYVYVVTKLPWPVKNRDVVARTKISYDASKNTVSFASIGEYLHVPLVEGLVRIPMSVSRWDITDTNDGYLNITFIYHADPGGAIPTWLTDLIVVKSPEIMINRLNKALQDKKWQDKNYPYDMDFIFGYPSPLKK